MIKFVWRALFWIPNLLITYRNSYTYINTNGTLITFIFPVAILKKADLAKTSTKKVIQELEKKLDVQLRSRKDEIDKIVMDYINSMNSGDESEGEKSEKEKSKSESGSDSDDKPRVSIILLSPVYLFVWVASDVSGRCPYLMLGGNFCLGITSLMLHRLRLPIMPDVALHCSCHPETCPNKPTLTNFFFTYLVICYRWNLCFNLPLTP